jgi:hypothetical protein
MNKMADAKVIKLNRRFKLHKEYGMEHAIRFDGWTTHAGKVEAFMREHFGSEYLWNNQSQWKTHWSKASGRGNVRPFFIGVKDEEMIFTAKLAGVL